MDIFRIAIHLKETQGLDSPAGGVRMLPFTGECEGKLFRGRVLPGGVDTQVFPTPEEGTLHARYMLEGVDHTGRKCKMYIDNRAVMRQGAETVTYPRIYTDSPALRFLETADLTGGLEFGEDGGLTIVIRSQDTPQRKHIALHRAGLTLRGVLERKTDKSCPLVLMLHGFGGDMGLDSHSQALSDQLTEAGLATLRFDFNGHGRSEGDFTAMTPYNEVEDAAAFLQYAQTLNNVTDIYVMGHSQGGVVGGMLAGYYPEVVKKLVLLAPAASLKTDAQQGHCMRADFDTEHIPYSVNVDGRHNVGGLYFRMAKTLPIFEVTGQYRGPMLVAFGGKDSVVSYTYAKQYVAKRSPEDFVFFPTLDHGLGGEEHEAMVEKVMAFLVK